VSFIEPEGILKAWNANVLNKINRTRTIIINSVSSLAEDLLFDKDFPETSSDDLFFIGGYEESKFFEEGKRTINVP
jgi:hypothetical protein